jgi:glutamate racemase
VSSEAIGIFDSGIGGLTVLQSVARLLPRESLIYLGDTARAPYGTKSAEAVTECAIDNASFLTDKGVKLLVVACNSASAVALDALRERHSVPVIGVVEPGARAAVETTRNGKVGVVGTEATIASGAYSRALRAHRSSVEVYTRACPLFVALAEEGWTENEVAERTAALYLTSLATSGIDTLILGCTHYPLLKGVIGAFLGPAVTLVDSAEATARVVQACLAERDLLRQDGEGRTSFFVTDAPERFVRVGERFLGQRVDSAVRLER